MYIYSCVALPAIIHAKQGNLLRPQRCLLRTHNSSQANTQPQQTHWQVTAQESGFHQLPEQLFVQFMTAALDGGLPEIAKTDFDV